MHDRGICHGDINGGNVLIFRDETGIIAKWTDFGLGYVSLRGEFTPSADLTDETLERRKQIDCTKLYSILHFIWEGLNINELDEYMQNLCNQFIEMKREIRKQKDLDIVLNTYGDLFRWTDRML